MNISFQGFKNAGVQQHIDKNLILNTILNFELKNDALGHDLDIFKKEFKDFNNTINPNFF